MATIGFRFLSWNLDNFGKYNYSASMTQIASTIIKSGADVAVILEVFAKGQGTNTTKKIKVGDDATTAQAKVTVKSLLSELQLQDPGSNWQQALSGVNAGSEKKDAYAFYWKQSPTGTAPPDYILPTTINLLEGPKIINDDGKGKTLSFAGSRRPGICKFEMINGTDTKTVWIGGLHASADFKIPNNIKKNITDALTAVTGILPTNNTAVVMGCDLNLNYDDYESFYSILEEDYNFSTYLTDGEGTSLLANPDFTVTSPEVAYNAFDNFLSKNLMHIMNWEFGVINVLNGIASKLPQTDGKGVKRTQADLLKEAYSLYYTKDTSTTSAISDHFSHHRVFRLLNLAPPT